MTTRRPVRVLIVDDEPLARQRLEDLLRATAGVEILGFAGDGDAAIDAIRSLAPDLVFLDVQMPGKTGLDVVREIGPRRMPATVFVTAYDRYALQAFDAAALDYLVKPFDDERFEQAFERARTLIDLQEVGKLSAQLMTVLGGTPSPKRAYLERIAVEMRGQVRVVPVGEIDYVTASGQYAEVHAGEKTYVIRERMQTLEERLDPAVFIRLHRSTIVRRDRIAKLRHDGSGVWYADLADGAEVRIGRTYLNHAKSIAGR